MGEPGPGSRRWMEKGLEVEYWGQVKVRGGDNVIWLYISLATILGYPVQEKFQSEKGVFSNDDFLLDLGGQYEF